MAGYGFRLYKVHVTRSLTATRHEPFDACGAYQDQHVGVWVRRLLEHLEQYDTLTRMPTLRVPDGDPYPEIAGHVSAEPDLDDPQIRFLRHKIAPSSHQYLFTVSYGTAGRFPYAMAPERARDVALGRMSTAQDYRCVLYLPQTGKAGALAVETVPTGGNPIKPLYAWLARAAVELAAEDAEAAEAVVANEGDEEADDARFAEPTPFRLYFNQAANFPKIKRMIDQSNETELVLRKTSVSTSGKPSKEKVKLTSRVTTSSEKKKATKWAADVYEAIVNDKADAAASIVELEDLVDGNVSGVGFNDGYLKVSGPDGTKKVGPGHLDKFFEYHVSTTQPTDTKFVQEVWKEVLALRVPMGLELPDVQ